MKRRNIVSNTCPFKKYEKYSAVLTIDLIDKTVSFMSSSYQVNTSFSE